MYYLSEEDIQDLKDRDAKVLKYLQSLEHVTEEIPCEIVEPLQLPDRK